MDPMDPEDPDGPGETTQEEDNYRLGLLTPKVSQAGDKIELLARLCIARFLIIIGIIFLAMITNLFLDAAQSFGLWLGLIPIGFHFLFPPAILGDWTIWLLVSFEVLFSIWPTTQTGVTILESYWNCLTQGQDCPPNSVIGFIQSFLLLILAVYLFAVSFKCFILLLKIADSQIIKAFPAAAYKAILEATSGKSRKRR